MADPTLLRTEVDGGVATITLTRVEARNALDMALKAELASAVEWAATDAAVRCVVITGSGGAFCAGGDIVEMALNDTPLTSRARLRTLLDTIFVPLAEMEKPTVAAVNGHAHGAGLSLALACDIVLVAESATLSCAFSKVGLVPDCGSLYFLPRRLPMGLVKELVFTGRRFGAAEAVAMGLANRAVADDALAAEAAGLAAGLAAGPTAAYGMTKTLLARSLQLGLRELSELEVFAQATAYATGDHLAARLAFAERGSPAFTGH